MSTKSNSDRGRTSRIRWPLFLSASALLALAVLSIWVNRPETPNLEADIVVYKTPMCECCNKWVAHLRDSGFDVATVNVSSTRPQQSEVGVPADLRSCHTAKVGDYWVEGHVPADLIQKLLRDKPENIKGLSAPGMPLGSPGMEDPNPVEYDVVALHTDGSVTVYATRQGQRPAP